MLTFTYRAYGLNISSEIVCPELIPADGAPDVRVRYGRVPEELANPSAQGVLYQVAAQQFLFKPNHIARFLVTNGSDVLVDRAPAATDDDVRVFLLGSVFGALLHQRGLLPLHASAIETRRGAVAFAGPVGLGKSTLAAAFHQRGNRILADDVCAVSLSARGTPSVTPAYPQLNLWADAVDKLGGRSTGLRRTRSLTEKYGLSVTRQFSLSSLPLYAVFELGTSNADQISLSEVKGLAKVAFVKDNTFRLRYLKGMARRDAYMRIVSAVAQHIRAVRVVRPDGAFMLDELVNRVENDLCL